MKDERAHLQLFDLIARDWIVPSPVTGIVFNAADSAVAFACADGSIHLAATADKASPNQRIRRAIDTGRLTIALRDKPFAGLKPADYTHGRTTTVVPHGPVNFAFAKDTGRINTLTPGGTAVHLPPRAPSAIHAVAATRDGETLAYSCGADVHVSPAKDAPAWSVRAPSPVAALAFSADDGTLAAAHETGLTLWAMDAPDAPPREVALSQPQTVSWRDDGAWLACCLASDGFCVVEAATGLVRHHGSFPSPVRFAEFGLTTNTVVASGAFRAAAWSLADGSPVKSGKAGLVLVGAIAACPTRNLIATGYANGLLSMAEIGQPSEILLREDTGAAITALAWSHDGNYLALAGSDGSAALIEFPASMFKS